MKINLLHKKLSKSLLLASMLTAFSFPSAYAGYYTPESGSSGLYINNITDASGTIYLPEWKDALIANSKLGNASGGRFTVNTDIIGGSFDVRSNSTVYVDSFNGKMYEILVSDSSTLTVDNTIFNFSEIKIYDTAVFKAPSLNSCTTVRLQQSAYAEFRATNVGYIEMYDNSVWKTVGSSTVSNLEMYGNTSIEFVMTSVGDVLKINNLQKSADNANINISFSNDLIEDAIANTGGTLGFYMDSAIVTTYISGEGYVKYNVLNSNGTYTWDVHDLGGGSFDAYNFTLIIPEPSTYAMIFGVLALGLAIYRRRK